MALLIVLLALGLVQIWGSGGPLHRDGWFLRWQQAVAGQQSVAQKPGFEFGVVILLPVLLSAILLVIAESILGGLGILLVSVPLLLYSFGRGNFNESLSSYLRAWYQGDLEAAYIEAEPLLKGVQSEIPSDAQSLHRIVFRAAAYRAFERLFAVLFWFLLLGVPGAVLYRLSQLYVGNCDIASVAEADAKSAAATGDGQLARKWLWLLEWLPVRVLGFTLAIVGNFAGCYRAWREHLTCKESGSADVLEYYLEGALGGIDSSECSAGVAVSEGQRLCGAELEALQGLLSRALLMWLTVLALYVIFVS
ncbi:regulatory signaling modulator protein AmpE [uncultured Microbulbifer sp.]|uniref:regulatory signaling modulator protein AmpE n=1 Tax=uncultured Microbulbifer sp. TaxID=348147 RepID=UPI0025D79688|nr:regulatory signaling modulator protein AmpE [uncultured Microbulbifer sp.]